MYLCTYVYYMILLYLEGSGSKFHSVNTKTSQFSSFFGFQELRKNMCIYNMYICTYVYYVILLYLEGSGSKFHSVNTKTSQFCEFFGVQELRKKYVNTKTSQFPQFWIPGVEKKLVYTYIYIIFKCVHMYITWFCYIWRVVVLSFIPSAPKLINFHHFWISGVEKKHVYIHIYI